MLVILVASVLGVSVYLKNEINKKIEDTQPSLTSVFSSFYVNENYLKKSKFTPDTILISDKFGNITSSAINIPFIEQCCNNIKNLINDVSNPSKDSLYSSLKIDTIYLKKPVTFKPGIPATLNATGNVEELVLPKNSILSTDVDGNISTAQLRFPDTNINDNVVALDTTFSSTKIESSYIKKIIAPPNAIVVADGQGNLVASGLTRNVLETCCANAGNPSKNVLIKSDIVDTSISTSQLYSSKKIDDTYTRKPTVAANSILMANATGQLVDSGITPTFIQTCCAQAVSAANDSLKKVDIVDASISNAKLYSSKKIDDTFAKKPVSLNAILMSDDKGNLVNSGYTKASLDECCDQATTATRDSLKKTDIVDTSISTSQLYSSKKIDDTYTRKPNVAANSILMANETGQLVDSGITPTFIQTCCAQAVSAANDSLKKVDIVDASISNAKLYSSKKIDDTFAKKPVALNAILMSDDKGNLVTSGYTKASLDECCAQATTATRDSLKKTDIVDTSISTSQLYSSKKIDDTYTRKPNVAANSILMSNSTGQLVDSGLTPTFIQSCCNQAVSAGNDSLKKVDIVDGSVSITKLYSSKKIDDTFIKKTIVPVDSFLMSDDKGNLVTSGYTKASLDECCAQATAATRDSLKKTDIVDTSISASQLYSSKKIDDTYTKKPVVAANSILMANATGQLVDSGLTPTFIQTCCAQAVTIGNDSLKKVDIVDGSVSTTKLYSSKKIDDTFIKKPIVPVDSFLMTDAKGNLVDSGYTKASLDECCAQATAATRDSLKKTDIVDTSISASQLYSSKKIDDTYTKKPSVAANSILMANAKGQLVDSGLTPTFIQTCCEQATAAGMDSLKNVDIVDTSTSTAKLYSSKKIDDTFIKKPTAAANSILMNDAQGNLVASGYTKTSLDECCSQTTVLKKTDIVDTAISTTQLYSSKKIEDTFLKINTPILFLSYKTNLPLSISPINSNVLLKHEISEFDNTGKTYTNGKFSPKVSGAWCVKSSVGAIGLVLNNRITLTVGKNVDLKPKYTSFFLNSDVLPGTVVTPRVEAIFVMNGTTDFISSYITLSKDTQTFQAIDFLDSNYFQAHYLGPV